MSVTGSASHEPLEAASGGFAVADAALPWRTVTGYGVGSLGTGVYSALPGVLLLYFLTDTLGVAAALASGAVVVPKLWSVAADPLVGAWLDRGDAARLRRSVLAGALGCLVSFALLFAVPPVLAGVDAALYVMALYAVAVTAYSAFSVPYVSLPATLSADVHERTRIIAVRMVFVFLGALLGSAVAPAVVGALGGGRPGYRGMSLVIGACAGSAMLVAWLTIRTRVSATPVANTAGRQRGLLQAVWRDRAFVMLLLRYLLLAAAIAIFTTALPYYSTHVLKQRETFLGLVFLVIVGASILAMPVWTVISRRTGKARALSASMLLLGLAALVLSAVTVAGPGVFACAAAVGIGMAGVQLTAFSLLADAVGERSDRAGALTGVWTAGEKLGLAAGPAVAGPLLAFAGFVSSTGAHVEQSAGALASIRALLGIAPAALIALAWLLPSHGAKEA